MSAIPAKARDAARSRFDGKCARCGSNGAEHHHRQRRREGGHGFWNLVLLCPTDHKWAHANPEAARENGYIISVHHDNPASAPIRTYAGWALFPEQGGVEWIDNNQ